MRQKVKLWEIAKVSAWNSAPQDEKLFKDWKYPFYRTADVGKVHHSRNLTEVKDYLNEEWIKWLKLYKKWTILFPKSWASTFLNHRVIMWQDGYVVSHLATISVNKDVDENFVYYYLTTVDAKDLCAEQWYPSLKSSNIAEVEIPVPPLETQKTIVAKLDQIFAELDQTKLEIQKNLDNTDELWKSALNQAFQGDREMKTIEELTTSIEYWIWETWLDKWDLRYVRITDIDEDYLLKDYDKKYIMLNEKSKLSILNKWDVLIARTWATFWKCLYFNSDEKSAFAWYLIRPNFKSEINTKYFSLFTQSWLYWNQANNLVSWWWQPQFNANAIKKVELPVPPLSEQEKIVEHLDQVSKEVKALKSQYQSQLDNLEELKKSVLDKAFRWELVE